QRRGVGAQQGAVGKPDPGDRAPRRERPAARRETTRRIDQYGDPDDDSDRESTDTRESLAEELHPARDDQVTARRQDTEEVAVEDFAAQNPHGPMEQDALIAE